MAVMLEGPCPKCGIKVKYGGNTWYEPVPLCKDCEINRKAHIED